MSNFKPVYLEWWNEEDLHNGNIQDKYVKCEICRENHRNVIEPAVVFIEENDTVTEQQIRNIQQNEDRIKTFIKNYYENKNVKGNLDNRLTCIFHCEKENEIWMVNYEKYEIDKNIKIHWNKYLVDEFWKRIRAYRFAVDYKENLIDFKNWNISSIEKTLIFFNTINLKLSKSSYNYDSYNFINFIFPMFYLYSFSISGNTDHTIRLEENEYKLKISVNFWFNEENLSFQKNAMFGSSKFLDVVYFALNRFTNVFFIQAKFYKDTFFSKIFSSKKIVFMGAEFHEKTILNFKKNLIFNMDGIHIHEKASFEITELNTCSLILNRIKNIYNNCYFYNIRIIPLKDCTKLMKKEKIKLNEENSKDKPNINIFNSFLNELQFINCDFSEAENIEIESSDLTETKFINTDWGEITKDRICENLFNKEPKKARDIYRQLKLALDKQEDHITANEFYALEMRAYENYLKQQGWNKNNWQEKLVFKIHKIASNFGQSWIRPLIFIVISTLFITALRNLDNRNLTIYFFDINSLIFVTSFIFSILFSLFYLFKNKEIIENNFIKINDIFYLFLFTTFSILLVVSFITDSKIREFFDEFAQSLNLFKVFGNEISDAGNKPYINGLKFIYTLYLLLLAFLTYQFIVAVRRKVKR